MFILNIFFKFNNLNHRLPYENQVYIVLLNKGRYENFEMMKKQS